MKTIKLLLISLALVTSLSGAKLYSVDYWKNYYINKLDHKQRNNINRIFVKSIQFDLHYSLSAMHLLETKAGDTMINFNEDKSYPYFSVDVGDLQINTKWYLKRQGRKVNRYTTARAIEELLNKETNYMEAVKQLQFFLKISDGNYREAYARYNGCHGKCKDAKTYAQNVINIIKVLRFFYGNIDLSRLGKNR